LPNWGSCVGANAQTVLNWLTKKGTVLETCDPYVASDVSCKSTCPYQKTVIEWRQFNGRVYPDPNVIKAALQTYGPLFTSMYAGDNDAWAASSARTAAATCCATPEPRIRTMPCFCGMGRCYGRLDRAQQLGHELGRARLLLHCLQLGQHRLLDLNVQRLLEL